MNKELEEAINVCERIIKNRKFNLCSKVDDNDMKAIKTVLNLIQQLQEENKQQDKIIDEMAGYLSIVRGCPNEDKGVNLDCENRCSNDDNIYEECWKMYFKKKAQEIN